MPGPVGTDAKRWIRIDTIDEGTRRGSAAAAHAFLLRAKHTLLSTRARGLSTKVRRNILARWRAAHAYHFRVKKHTLPSSRARGVGTIRWNSLLARYAAHAPLFRVKPTLPPIRARGHSTIQWKSISAQQRQASAVGANHVGRGAVRNHSALRVRAGSAADDSGDRADETIQAVTIVSAPVAT